MMSKSKFEWKYSVILSFLLLLKDLDMQFEMFYLEMVDSVSSVTFRKITKI